MQSFEVKICASLRNKYPGSKNKDGCCGFAIEHHYKKTRGFFKYHCKVFFLSIFDFKAVAWPANDSEDNQIFQEFRNAEIKTLQNVEKHIPHLQMTQIEENEQYVDNLQNSCHFMVMSKLKMIPDYL